MALPSVQDKGQNPEYIDERFTAIEAELVNLRKDHRRLKIGFIAYVVILLAIDLILR